MDSGKAATSSPLQVPPGRPLAEMAAGEQVVVRGYTAGAGFQSRLRAMGLTVGQKLLIIQNHGGMVMVSLNGGRVALGQGMSRKILVEPLASVSR